MRRSRRNEEDMAPLSEEDSMMDLRYFFELDQASTGTWSRRQLRQCKIVLLSGLSCFLPECTVSLTAADRKKAGKTWKLRSSMIHLYFVSGNFAVVTRDVVQEPQLQHRP